MEKRRCLFPFACSIAILAGCSDSGTQKATATGGTGKGGNVVVTGGSVGGSGGALTGGTPSTGGVAATGGVTSTGGRSTTGGGTSTGGLSSTGGVSSTGGAGSTGGVPTTGGVAATGGVAVTGGTSVSGGAGGGNRTGGVPSTGGAGSGGASPDAGAPDSASATGGQPAMAGWVLSYFRPEQSADADSLYLAYSTDGLRWKALGSGKPAYKLSGLGTNHIRDPYILRKPEGGFVYIATDWTLSNNDSNYWNNPSSKIFVADSADLKTFTNPRLLTLTSMKGPSGKAMHVWAPEAYYDAATKQYSIIWSGNDSTDRNRIYLSTTVDFKTLVAAEPKILFDPGYTVIDGTFVTEKGMGYLFYKDETGAGKDIQIARSSSESLAPGFTRMDAAYVSRGTAQGTQLNTEGPFVIRDPAKARWLLFADFFTQGGVFGCWSSPTLDASPSSWTRLPTSEYSFPAGVRHANAVPVTKSELDAVIAYYADK